jgi:hypothetical protein
MIDHIEEPTRVTRTLVPDDQRLAVIEETFGAHFPLMIEPVAYGITERMAEAYSGGYWQMYALDNGGFYMAPEGNSVYQVSCENCFSGELSADALGVTACLYAYSHCSFSRNEAFGRICAQHYHWLRAYMYDHTEVAAMLGAIDCPPPRGNICPIHPTHLTHSTPIQVPQGLANTGLASGASGLFLVSSTCYQITPVTPVTLTS